MLEWDEIGGDADVLQSRRVPDKPRKRIYFASTGLPLKPGDLVALEAFCDANDISPIKSYGRKIVSQNREVVVVNGVKKLYKSAVVRI